MSNCKSDECGCKCSDEPRPTRKEISQAFDEFIKKVIKKAREIK